MLIPPCRSPGRHAPRRSAGNATLPSARRLVTAFLADRNVPSRTSNIMFMTWAQLVSHDVARLQAPFPRSRHLGDVVVVRPPLAAHSHEPLPADNGRCCAVEEPTDQCSRIPVPADDPFFPRFGVTCFGVERGAAAPCNVSRHRHHPDDGDDHALEPPRPGKTVSPARRARPSSRTASSRTTWTRPSRTAPTPRPPTACASSAAAASARRSSWARSSCRGAPAEAWTQVEHRLDVHLVGFSIEMSVSLARRRRQGDHHADAGAAADAVPAGAQPRGAPPVRRERAVGRRAPVPGDAPHRHRPVAAHHVPGLPAQAHRYGVALKDRNPVAIRAGAATRVEPLPPSPFPFR